MLDLDDDPGACQDDDMGPLLEPLLLNAKVKVPLAPFLCSVVATAHMWLVTWAYDNAMN